MSARTIDLIELIERISVKSYINRENEFRKQMSNDRKHYGDSFEKIHRNWASNFANINKTIVLIENLKNALMTNVKL